ncbi:MAG: prolyl oligopeptidase family serine peptidase [Pseudomonadota bacterium]
MIRIRSLLLILTGLAPVIAIADLIPMTAWIHDPVISSVRVSPNGNRIAAITLSNVNEAPDVTIWDTSDLSKPPERFKPSDSKAVSVSWLNNETLFVNGLQKFDQRVGGRFIKAIRTRAYLANADAQRFRSLFSGGAEADEIFQVNLFHRLPLEKDNILVEAINFEFASDIYEIDLNTRRSKRVFRGATGESFIPDPYGKIRGRFTFAGDGDTSRIEYAYRHTTDDRWETHHSLIAVDREGMQPVGMDIDGRTVYMRDNKGREKNVIRKYDIVSRELSDPIYADATFEATGVIQSERPEDFGQLIGFTALSDKNIVEYTDEDWAKLQSRIDEALPAEYNSITSMSDDKTIAVVQSSGPKEPGAFYLLINGEQLMSLGRAYPFLERDKLATMEYVTYKARDGLEIPAYLTYPTEGEAPYPAVVMPHGGPWSRDLYSWDSWAQFLANRGYLVLQPQYRGSDEWGQTLWRAGDREWGQKMQDDKDDGAMWLVEQGLADADRLAMHGFSYGGYASMAAVVRDDPPYQCAIAGAGLAELRTFDKMTFETRFGRQFQNPTIAGMSPLDEVENASIPLMIYHGDRDQIVPVEQSRKYFKALQRAEKDVEYIEIPDMPHGTPWPQHRLALFEILEDYLANRCGPGGL